MLIPSLAWRNIWRNQRRSLIIMLSVAIGLFCGLLALSLYTGMMRARVKTVIESETSHYQIHHPSFKDDQDQIFIVPDFQRVQDSIRLLPGFQAMALRSVSPAMLTTTSGGAGIQVYGIDPKDESTVTGLDSKIIEGTGFETGKNKTIYIGKKLADKMKIRIGNKIVLTFSAPDGEMIAAAFRISAIYRSDNSQLDERNAFVRRAEWNELLGIGPEAHEIAVLLKNDAFTHAHLNHLRAEFPGLAIESWREISPETELMVNTLDTYSWIIMFIILLALAFGIINTMLMSVLERTREIGMMMALGMTKRRLFALIALETSFLTLCGIPPGMLAAWIWVTYYRWHGIDMAGKREELMRSFGFSTTIYPEFPSSQMTDIMFLVTITAFASCLLPVSRVMRMKPVDVLGK